MAAVLRLAHFHRKNTRTRLEVLVIYRSRLPSIRGGSLTVVEGSSATYTSPSTSTIWSSTAKNMELGKTGGMSESYFQRAVGIH